MQAARCTGEAAALGSPHLQPPFGVRHSLSVFAIHCSAFHRQNGGSRTLQMLADIPIEASQRVQNLPICLLHSNTAVWCEAAAQATSRVVRVAMW